MVFKHWLFQTAFKYIFTKRSAFWIILISIIGITLGVAILIVVMSIMNGSQMVYYENSQELLSYHIRIESDQNLDDSKKFANKIRLELSKDVTSVNLFYEVLGMIVNERGRQIIVTVRGVEPNVMALDPKMKKYLSLKTGEFDLNKPDHIILGSDMATRLSVTTGSKLSFYSLGGGTVDSVEQIERIFTVAGVYETDWGVGVDSILAFVPLNQYETIAKGLNYQIGLKLENSNRDDTVMQQVKNLNIPNEWTIEGWREYNRSFFGALRMEKMIMLLLVVLIFLVFAVNTYNGLKRLIYDKQDELAVMRAMGATPFEVRAIFIIQGVVIALIGTILGSYLGLLFTVNIAPFRNFFLTIRDEFFYRFIPSAGYRYNFSQLAINQPRILFKDLFIINLLALVITTFSAFLASVRIGKIKPAEVLRYE